MRERPWERETERDRQVQQSSMSASRAASAAQAAAEHAAALRAQAAASWPAAETTASSLDEACLKLDDVLGRVGAALRAVNDQYISEAGRNGAKAAAPPGVDHVHPADAADEEAAALAELGFITVLIDGRGCSYRDKMFHDHSYGKTHLGSDLADHVAGIQQLAERYPYMDLDRVGIADTGGSNAPVYGLLAYPEFYKAGAVNSIFDIRLIKQGEVYGGLSPQGNSEASVLCSMAKNLQGQLLVIQGMMDGFFHPAGAFQLIDTLIRENKNFDVVMLPNGGHASETQCYGLRRMWDHLVKNVIGNEPPTPVKIKNATDVLLEIMLS